MKAALYAVSYRHEWKWNLTIDLTVDMNYRFERYGADLSILLFEPLISLGQAEALRRKLISLTPTPTTTPQNDISPTTANYPQETTSTTKLNKQTSTSKSTFTTKSTQTMLNTIQQYASQFGMSDQTLQLKLISYSDWLNGNFPKANIDETIYRKFVSAVRGRSLLKEELMQLFEHYGLKNSEFSWTSYLQYGHLLGDLVITNGLKMEEARERPFFWRKSTQYECKRCRSGSDRMFRSECPFCGTDCAYCEECLTMGRNRFCSLLVHGTGAKPILDTRNVNDDLLRKGKPALTGLELDDNLERWGLSSAQAAASREGLRFIRDSTLSTEKQTRNAGETCPEPPCFLIWAVTGAGKTEMIFPLIQYELSRGGRVLVAAPRKDVVLELKPRITKAFADYKIVTLYGGSEERWESGDVTIATTHQLLRFWQAFDLVIIDEIDAFPYHNNPMLEYAARKVCKSDGKYILLSATPPRQLQVAVKKKRIEHVKVPARYHRNPLPIPEWMATRTVRKMIETQKLAPPLIKKLEISVDRGAQVFLFVPNINIVEPLVMLLRRLLHSSRNEMLVIEGTSSKDPHRTEKVQQFRQGAIRILVTTTILERGVTVPKTDVFILDADSNLFDEAALVQMAGRAGRSKEDPAGKVYFAAKDKTKSQVGAIRQIKNMNRLARKKGYLLKKGEQG